eukprot:304950_1
MKISCVDTHLISGIQCNVFDVKHCHFIRYSIFFGCTLCVWRANELYSNVVLPYYRIGWVGSFVTLSPFYFVHHRYNRIVDTIGDEIDVLLHRFGIYLDLDAASYLDPYIITTVTIISCVIIHCLRTMYVNVSWVNLASFMVVLDRQIVMDKGWITFITAT